MNLGISYDHGSFCSASQHTVVLHTGLLIIPVIPFGLQGVQELIAALKARGVEVFLISGGFRYAPGGHSVSPPSLLAAGAFLTVSPTRFLMALPNYSTKMRPTHVFAGRWRCPSPRTCKSQPRTSSATPCPGSWMTTASPSACRCVHILFLVPLGMSI